MQTTMKTTNETKNTMAADKPDAQKGLPPKLGDLEISIWNRSHGAKLDADYIKPLAADIKANGLVNPDRKSTRLNSSHT